MTRSWRSITSAACLAAVVFLAAACGKPSSGVDRTTPSSAPPTCDPIYQALRYTPSEVQAAEQGGRCLEQDLNLTGEVTSHARVGFLLPTFLGCRSDVDNIVRGTAFYFFEGNQIYKLSIAPDAPYTGSAQDLALQAGPQNQIFLTNDPAVGTSQWTQQSGSIHVNADSKSGTVDAVLARDARGAGQVHMTGTWRCAK